MKKIIIGLALAAACGSPSQQFQGASSPQRRSGTAAGQIGAADATLAVKGFMVAAKTTDLQAMGNLWGDQSGLARDRFSREELQKRELFVMRCLRHDSYNIVGEAPSLGGARAIVVQVSYGDITRSANVEVVRGPSDRWYVRDVDTKSLQDICMRHV
jgi:hypothetical protein